MAKQTVNIGTSANDRTGDSLRTAFNKINDNFNELYTALGLGDNTLNLGAFTFTGSVIDTDDSSNITINKPVTVNGEVVVNGDITPATPEGGNLGSSTHPWHSLYVSNNTIYIGGVALSVDENGNLTVGDSTLTGIGGGGGASYDQDLNTTDDVEFNYLTADRVYGDVFCSNPLVGGQIIDSFNKDITANLINADQVVTNSISPVGNNLVISGNNKGISFVGVGTNQFIDFTNGGSPFLGVRFNGVDVVGLYDPTDYASAWTSAGLSTPNNLQQAIDFIISKLALL